MITQWLHYKSQLNDTIEIGNKIGQVKIDWNDEQSVEMNNDGDVEYFVCLKFLLSRKTNTKYKQSLLILILNLFWRKLILEINF